MKRLKHNFKKGMAFVLSLAMVAGLVPVMSGGANTVQAATGSGTEPSVTAYATKDQLMTAFTPDANGTATTKGKLVFGKNENGEAQEWYILGKDTGVSGDNTIIFAASPIATGQVFEDDRQNNQTYNTSYGVYTSNPENVYPNHYGASDLRVALQNMATNISYFTTDEQGLMIATTVTTKDTENKDGSGNYLTYTTTDKLYALQGDYNNNQYLWAGTSDNTVLAMSSYWSSGDRFWLRSPYDSSDGSALLAFPEYCVGYNGVSIGNAVQPASNLDLSSVLFASAAKAASSDTVSDTITSVTAMTLRLDGSSKNIGTVEYSATTGDIKAVKGNTSQTVALIVQGRGTVGGEEKDWYYSKQIMGTDTVNVSAIEAETNTPASIDLSTCKIWLEITDADELIYAVNATETVVSDISSVAITDIATPAANTTLDTFVSCETTGVNSTAPQIMWTPSDTTAGYNTNYTASITLTADTFYYAFADNVTATVSGNPATSVTKNADGTLTVTYAFPATAKDKIISITTPQAITVANGTAYDAMNLPATVNIVTEGNTVSSAPVTWNTTTPAGGSYDPSVLTGQTVTLNGAVICPDSIDDNGVTLTTTITITISAAGIVGAPTANPIAGTYTENQSVTLTSSTEGARIYYTTDGSEPVFSDGKPGGTTVEYTAPVKVEGIEGRKVELTIKAIAVRDGMQNSAVQAFTYTISLPVSKYTITAGAGANGSISPSGTVEVEKGSSRTFTIKADKGYVIDTLKVDNTAVSVTTGYTFTNVTADHTIAVTFKKASGQNTVSKAQKKKNDQALNSKLKVSQTGKKIRISWGKVTGASGYHVYVQYYGKKFTKKSVMNVSGKKTSLTITRVNGKKLNLKKQYKLYVEAYKTVGGRQVIIGKSIQAHVAGRENSKYANVKAVRLNRSSYKLKTGKSVTIKAKTVLEDKTKKALPKGHVAEFRYDTSNKSVATVSSKGRIKAVGKGTCKIYVYAANGNTKTIKVTVK